MLASLLRLLVLFSAFPPICLAGELAWNGYTPPGSLVKTSLTPFYVPPGAKNYPSRSKLLTYRGNWRVSTSGDRWTTSPKASVQLVFHGAGIELFGSKGPAHGVFCVELDGETLTCTDTYAPSDLHDQRLFWLFGLPSTRHVIKIINQGKHSQGKANPVITIKAFVVNQPIHHNDAAGHDQVLPRETTDWSITQGGVTGVNAMQIAVVSSTLAIIIDKVEHNPLTVDGHPAWAALFNLYTHAVTPLRLQSNSFCAGGSFLSNGTLVNVGGNPVVHDYTSSADFGDVDGMQSIRLFDPCRGDVESCTVYENPERIRMASPRWYATATRLQDGSAIIVGGSKRGGWINNATTNNPTVEYFPPKSIHRSKGLPIPLDFLDYTLNSNLFPIVFLLPGGTLFMAANNDAIIYDWKNNQERKLPPIPNGVRVTYPMTASAVLLPLTEANNFTPEVLICGGSQVDDNIPSWEMSSQDIASDQCARMVLDEAGIEAGWEVDHMPEPRHMADAVLLPTGEVLIVNGARTGISGYGNIQDQIGASNADHPLLSPVLYDPYAPLGSRFPDREMPSSNIPRMYHSVATLTPAGNIMIAGSNPNLDRSEERFGTEYRVEWLDPAYFKEDRPVIEKPVHQVDYAENFTIELRVPKSLRSKDIKVALMDLGYVTHGVHANSRLVNLAITRWDGEKLSITAPATSGLYPPGPAWLYVVIGGVPSKGIKVMVGNGKGPEVDREAVKKYVP